MKVGLIGFGRWGKNLARAIAASADLAWVADADITQRSAAVNAYPGAVGLPADALSAPCEFLGGQSPYDAVSAVVIATPIETHELLVRAALSAGKHVLCEKPLSRSKAQAEGLAADAERRGLTLMCDFTWLGHAGVLSILDGNGDIYAARRWAKDDRGFDALEDLLPHDVALACRHFGCDAKRVRVDRECVDIRFGDVGYSGFQLAELSYRYDSDERHRRVGTVAGINDGENLPDAPEPLSVILDEFIAAIREHRQPRIGGAAEFVHVAAVIEAAKESRKRGGGWVDVV